MASEEHVNGVNGHAKSGLKVLVIGAGIGGLTAAIALRRQGHDVEIFESSKFATETGAAIHLPPNATGLLKRLGISIAETGANECESLTSFTALGHQLHHVPFKRGDELWQHKWMLAHRIKLHSTLKDAATSATGPGFPAKLHVASPVVDIDPQTATITLKDGTTYQGGLVVGADGVHSVARAKLVGGDKKAFGSGKNAFRFLVPRQAILDDPQTQRFAQQNGNMIVVYGRDRRIVMYPTSHNTLLNFVCIHPHEETDSQATGDWNNKSNKTMLLEVFKDFHEDFRAVLNKVDENSLRVWKLLDMEVLSTWINERLVLIGDAAHPFLPHQGQGGSQAIEDGMALGVVLERGVQAADVPQRLKLFEQIRLERAHLIQHYSRVAGEDNLKPADAAKIMFDFTNYNFGHDEYDNATQKLREWKWDLEPKTYWRMPIAFGPMPGPRQTVDSKPRNGVNQTFTTASIRFKTSRTVLQNLFPPGARAKRWRFKSPGTFAQASFSQTTLDKMEWLGGKGYNHIGLYVHGVQYQKDDGTFVDGTYMPILFESLTDPIVSGREELGMPKLYSAIDVERDSTSYHIRTSWQGLTWGRFELDDLQQSSDATGVTGKISGDDGDNGILVHRYIPAVGRAHKGETEADYAVFDPFSEAEPTPRPQSVYKAGTARIHLNARDVTALPTLHHIISRLAEIPVYEVIGGKVVEGTGVPDVSGARRVEEYTA